MELDFSRQLHYFWALMPEMILCVWGMVVLLTGVSRSQKDSAKTEPRDPSFGGPADLGWLALVGPPAPNLSRTTATANPP